MCMTITHALDLLFEDNKRRMLAPASIHYYQENLNRFKEWLAARNVTKTKRVTEKVVNDYMLYLVETVGNKTSVNTYLRAVRRFINFLIEKSEIKPFSVTLLTDNYKIKPTLDNSEVELIIKSVSPKDDTSVIMLLLLSTGMRSRTLCELRVKDVHFEDRYIDLKNTKSGMPLCPPLSINVLACIREYIYHAGLMPNDYLFRNSIGNPFDKHSLRKRLCKGLHKLGIHKSGVHIFRHTFGKIMSMNGCPTAILQKWLGHSDIKITQKYTDLYCDDLRRSMELLPSAEFACENNF